jgi:hypothetical protein
MFDISRRVGRVIETHQELMVGLAKLDTPYK